MEGAELAPGSANALPGDVDTSPFRGFGPSYTLRCRCGNPCVAFYTVVWLPGEFGLVEDFCYLCGADFTEQCFVILIGGHVMCWIR